MKNYYFGWNNIKKGMTEIVNMYSTKPSFFSKKRIESGIAFAVGQWGMIYFLINTIDKMTSSDMFIWAGVEFAVSGYMINQIQKEKSVKKESDNPESSEQLNS